MLAREDTTKEASIFSLPVVPVVATVKSSAPVCPSVAVPIKTFPVFGKVVAGMSVVKTIEGCRTDGRDKPVEPQQIISVTRVDA